jgi:hypothetical protein
MKNEFTYKIPQSKVKEILKLDSLQFQELKRVFNLNTVEPVSFNILRGFISYQKRLNKTDIDIESLKLDEFIVKNDDLKTFEFEKDIPEPKKIKVSRNEILIEKKTIKVQKRKAVKQTISKIKKDSSPKQIGRKARVFTPEEDKKILDFFHSDWYKNQNKNKHKNPYTMQKLCKDLKASDRKVISRRASELGFTNFVLPAASREFTNKELDLLKECLGKYKATKIQSILKENGFKRSIVAINVQVQRLQLSLKLTGKGDLSLRLMAEAFGVDAHFFSNNESRIKKLKPTKTSKELIFTRENIKKYVIENPYDFNMGKVNNKFLIELLTGE